MAPGPTTTNNVLLLLQHAISSLAKLLHVSHKLFAIAGTKDKRGVTVQQVGRMQSLMVAGLLQYNYSMLHVLHSPAWAGRHTMLVFCEVPLHA